MIDLDIVVDGVHYAARFWPAVPRAGDRIALRDTETNTTKYAEVQSVFWGTSDSSVRMAPGDTLRVSLICATVASVQDKPR